MDMVYINGCKIILTQWAFLNVFLMSNCFAKDRAYIKHGPSNTKGAKDFDVTLYCQVADKGKSNLYWHCNSANGQQDITVGPDVNTNPALNTKYVIDNKGASVGQYNLIITNVTSLDSGTCSCIIDTGRDNAIEKSAILEITDIARPPSPPTCTIDKISTPGQTRRIFTADYEIQLMCISVGGIPLADLHWEIVRQGSAGKGVEIVSSIITEAYSGSGQDSITAISNYKVMASDDGAYFQCIQNHVTLNYYPGSCSPVFRNRNGTISQVGSPEFPIEVKYRPVLRFFPSTLTVTPTERLTKLLKCEADSNPRMDSGPVIMFKSQTGETIKWNYATEGRQDVVNLHVDQNDVGKILECIGRNEVGYSLIKIKIKSTGILPTWIIIIIIGATGLSLFLITLIICYVCFSRDQGDKDTHCLNWSQPGSFQGNEVGVDEYPYRSDGELLNIHEFEGGMEMKENNRWKYNAGYIDEYDDNVNDDEDAVPQVPTAKESHPSTRTYDAVPVD